MPTGYTVDLYQGKDVSFSDFLQRCARAFVLECRESSTEALPRTPWIQEDHLAYLLKRQEENDLESKRLDSLSESEWESTYRATKEKYEAQVKESEEERQRLGKRYFQMRERVAGWQPSKQSLQNLKRFMLEQLDSSIETDLFAFIPSVEDSLSSFQESKKQSVLEEKKRLEAEIEAANERKKEWQDYLDALWLEIDSIRKQE